MKYSEMDEYKRDAIKEFLFQTANFYKQEEIWFTQKFFQLFIVANGFGIIILTTYMGALASNGKTIMHLIFPLISFIIGALLGGVMVWYTLGVINVSLRKIREQMLKIFQDELDFNKYESWGFSRKGLVTVGIFQIISVGAFLLGILFSLIRVSCL